MKHSTMQLMNTIKQNEIIHICVTAAAVVGSLLVYGVLQEKLMSQSFHGETFNYSLFPVLCNRLLQSAIAAGVLVAKRDWVSLKPVAPIYAYAAVSFSNVVATTCQYEALKYFSFPVQTLGKCCKMFPVMIWGIIILKKKYNLKDYLIALSITLGCAMFIVTGPFKSSRASSSTATDGTMMGTALMLGYLGFDGFTSTFQDRLFKGYHMTAFNQVLYTSLCSAILSASGLLLSGNLLPAISFAFNHHEAMRAIGTISVAATIGSLCISYTIKTFGALVFATIMTTRQLLSIFTSNMVFGRSMSLGQWCAVFVVFATLYYQALNRKPRSKSKEKTQQGEGLLEEQPLLPSLQVTDKLSTTVGAKQHITA